MKTSHEIARELLAGPDLPLVIPHNDCFCVGSVRSIDARQISGPYKGQDPESHFQRVDSGGIPAIILESE